jgi:hypothetical protein
MFDHGSLRRINPGNGLPMNGLPYISDNHYGCDSHSWGYTLDL